MIQLHLPDFLCCFFVTSSTEIYTLSLHDALPIYPVRRRIVLSGRIRVRRDGRLQIEHLAGNRFHFRRVNESVAAHPRSEEHTSELQSLTNLVCRLLLEKKKHKHSPPYDEQL